MKLLEFPHSHYCEKARWALDYKSIMFQAVPIMPGFHMITVRKYAQATSVPVLLNKNEVVQGSSAIIDYLDQNYPSPLLTPAGTEQRRQCSEIEKMADEKLGVNLRCILYDRLLAYPDFIRHCFTHSMTRYKQLIFTLFFPVLRRKIYQTYVSSATRVEEAKTELNAALDDIAEKLMQNRYLVGNHFSRADLTVASMLSILVMPTEHPFPWREIPDSEMRIFYNKYRRHPASKWVSAMYSEHRLPQRAEAP